MSGHCDEKYEFETFNVRNIIVLIIAAMEWGKCPFKIFGARGKYGANNVHITHDDSASVVNAATVLHILHILHSAQIISEVNVHATRRS